MVELRNDMMRRAKFDTASRDARLDDFDYSMHQTMDERLGIMREKRLGPKKRIPWFLIITVISCAPLFFMGEEGKKNALASIPSQQSSVEQYPEEELKQAISGGNVEEMATITVTIGGKTMSKQIPVSELQAMQSNM